MFALFSGLLVSLGPMEKIETAPSSIFGRGGVARLRDNLHDYCFCFWVILLRGAMHKTNIFGFDWVDNGLWRRNNVTDGHPAALWPEIFRRGLRRSEARRSKEINSFKFASGFGFIFIWRRVS